MITFIVGAIIESSDYLKETIEKVSEDNRYIIACDKGYLNLNAAGIKPDLVIGDFDSAGADVLMDIPSDIKLIRLNPIKDDTDIEAALLYAIENTEGEIIILGALGKRVDHSLGNIALLGMGLKHDRKVYLQDAKNRLQMIRGGSEVVLEKCNQYGKYVSVFPYGGKADKVTMKGVKYPLENALIEGFNTLTVSNEIVDDVAVISVEDGYLLICECAD